MREPQRRRPAKAAARLPAKLSRPRLHRVVDRSRLFELIDSHGDCALVWLSGPPGAGKTVLASSWLARRYVTALWLRLDEADAEPATFFSYLAQAAQATPRGRTLQLSALTPEYLADLRAFARGFFRRLFDVLPQRAALVLDGYENAQGEVLDQLLAVAVAEVPAGQRIVVTSRGEPPAALSHLSATGAMARVAWEDLRLTAAEARAIARNAQIRPVMELGRLLVLSDGWVAGFVALLAHAHRTGLPDGQGPPPRELLFGYFAGALFASADAATREVLLLTALMPAFTAAQAEALCPEVDAQAIVQRLYRAHYFLDRTADEEPQYRYLALFRDFLLEQGRALLDKKARSVLLTRAAGLLQAVEQNEAAVELLLEAAAWSEAGRAICELAGSLLAHGRNAQLDRWIAALPEAMVQAVPWLGYWLGLALMPFAPPAARALLEAAHARFEADGDTTGRLLCAAGVLETYWLEWGDVRPIDRWAAEIETLMDRPDTFPDEDAEIRVLGALGGLQFRMVAQGALMHKAARRAGELLTRTNDRIRRLTLANVMNWYYVLLAHWPEARANVEAYEPESKYDDVPAQLRLCWWLNRCVALYSSGYFVQADDEMEHAVEWAHTSGVHVFDATLAGQGAFYALNARNLGRVQLWLERMKAALLPTQEMHATLYEHLRAAHALLVGKAALALALEQPALGRTIACGSDLAEGHHRIGLGVELVALGRAAEAIAEAVVLRRKLTRVLHRKLTRLSEPKYGPGLVGFHSLSVPPCLG